MKKVFLSAFCLAVLSASTLAQTQDSVVKKIVIKGDKPGEEKEMVIIKKYITKGDSLADAAVIQEIEKNGGKVIRREIIVDTDGINETIKEIETEEDIVIMEGDNLRKAEGDTTVISLKKKKLVIVDEKGETEILVDKGNGKLDRITGWENEGDSDAVEEEMHCDAKTKKHRGTDVDFFALDLGLNNYVQGSHVGRTAELDPLALNTFKSVNVTTHFLPTKVALLGDGHVNLESAISIDFNNYRFTNDFRLNPDTDTLNLIPMAQDLRKNKLLTTYAQIPLMLNFNTDPDGDDGLSVSVGGYVGYLLGARNKWVEQDGTKSKEFDNFGVEPLRYGLTARVDFAWFDVYVNYNLSDMFVEGYGPKTQTFSAGINLIDF